MGSAQHLSSSELESKIGAVIAFASKVNHMPSYDEERLLRPNAIPTGLNLRSANNTASDDRRFMAVLDSLANLSISEERHQVHAIGMTVFSGSASGMAVQLVISGNRDIPNATEQH